MDEQLEELAIEIFELKEKLKETKEENKKVHREYVLDQIKTSLKKFTAIAAVPTIGTAITTLAGWNPFKLNEEKQQVYTMTNIDKYGETSGEKNYKEFFEIKTNESKLNFYTKWQPTEDNKYEREKYTYVVSENDLETISELIETNTYITETKLNELFSNPKTVEKEQRVELTIEELACPSYVEASIMKKNNGEYIKSLETETSHKEKLLIKLLIEALALLAEISLLEEHTKFFDKIEKSEGRDIPEEKDLEEIRKKIKTKQLQFRKIKATQKGH